MTTSNQVMECTAAARVFNIFELLQTILIDVLTAAPDSDFHQRLARIKVIYRMQRVNATFRDVISRSKLLRVGMLKEYRSEKGDGYTYDHRLRKQDEAASIRFGNSVLSTVFHKLDSIRSPGWKYGWKCNKYPPGVVTCDYFIGANPPIDESSFSAASWRHMLFALDKTLQYNVSIHVRVQYPGSFTPHKIELKEGATIGELADEIMKAVKIEVARVSAMTLRGQSSRVKWRVR